MGVIRTLLFFIFAGCAFYLAIVAVGAFITAGWWTLLAFAVIGLLVIICVRAHNRDLRARGGKDYWRQDGTSR